MKGNTKHKPINNLKKDWVQTSVPSRRVLAHQKTSRVIKFRYLLAKLLSKSIFILLIVFIVYQVFIKAFDLTERIRPLDFITNYIGQIFQSNKLSVNQIFDTKVYLEPFSSLTQADFFEQATVKAPIRNGDKVEQILIRYGFSAQDSESVQASLDQYIEKNSTSVVLRQGENIEILMSAEGLPTKVRLPLNSNSLVSISRSDSGKYEVSVDDIQVKTGERILFGSIESSFAAAATKSGLSYDLVDDLVDVFSDRVSFHKDFRKGDRFTVIYQEHEAVDGKKTTSGPILAAALEVKGKYFIAVRFVGADGKSRYYNENGQILGDSFLRFPLKFSKISSYFTTARFHPVLKVKRPHNGVDFAAPIGTPVRSVGDGFIKFAGRQGGHGIIVEVKHSDRFVTGYSHLSTIASGIKRGQLVKRGQVIGAVGMTGLATGPHLHFSLYDNSKYVDPLKSDLPRLEEMNAGSGMSERYFKRALFTLEHYQDVVSNSVHSNFN
jgi:murein DD-endopeptidase MepM/ murein hydrolase activator NlpD